MLDKFSWLHLSDFHFRVDGDNFSQDVSAKAILADIYSRLAGEYPLQFVVVTGDIAFSGKYGEYQYAGQFFSSLADELGLPLNRVFLVPGNHDVNRGLYQLTYEGAQGRLTNQQAVDDFLGSEAERSLLMERQSAYESFRGQYLVDLTSNNTDDGLGRVQALDLDGLRICVLELNSAWLSGTKDEAGKLLIGERQMINALELADQHRPHLVIALAHHPAEWLAEFDRMSFNGRLLPRLDVFHSGHLHRHEVSVRLMPGSECLLISAGSSHASRYYENSYNLIEFDVGDAICRVRRFEYKPESGMFNEILATDYSISLGRTLSEEAGEIADIIRDIQPAVVPYADYLAALLVGDMNEVPIKMDEGSWIFASRGFRSEYQFAEVQDFFRIQNMLRVYDDVPVKERLVAHSPAIMRLTNLLSDMRASDSEFADMLDGRLSQAKKLTGRGQGARMPFQVQYMDELASTSEWSELAATAKRYMTSSDEEVRTAAQRNFSIALLQSDDLSDRTEGLILAYKVIDEPWANVLDHIVAATTAEIHGEPERAVSTAVAALARWPSDVQLRDHCRSLAVRTGSRELRQLLDKTGVNGQ